MQQSINPPQCQRYITPMPTASSAFHRDHHYNTMPRDAHAYDPIYNTESWFARQAVPLHATPHNSSSWGEAFNPSINTWNSYSGDIHAVSQNGSYSGYIRAGANNHINNENRNPNQFGGHGNMRRDRGGPSVGAPDLNSAGDTPGHASHPNSLLSSHPGTTSASATPASGRTHFSHSDYPGSSLDVYNTPYETGRNNLERIARIDAASRMARAEGRTCENALHILSKNWS